MEWPLRIKTRSLIAVVTASLVLAACTTTPPGDQIATSAAPANAPAATPTSQLRELTPQEKKVIVDAIAPSLKEPGAAKYKWTKFPMVPPSDDVSYCATVDAKSPYAAYSGHQSYIVDTKVTGGHITAAVLGLIAGGKDAAIVAGMCEKHGLDPNSAT
jgi:outer membrane murein-binding lipoprotein Lpp